jgi:hypothetical protein
LSDNRGYWNHVLKVFEPLRVEEFIVQAWFDILKSKPTWHKSNFKKGLEAFHSVFNGYPSDVRIPYAVLSSMAPKQQRILGRRYYAALTAFVVQITTPPKGTRFTPDVDSSFQFPLMTYDHLIIEGEYLVELQQSLHKQELHTVAQQYDALNKSEGGRFIEQGTKLLLLPFVASVLSLTSLLDFGGDLLNVYQPNIWSTVGTVWPAQIFTFLLATSIFFGYPWWSKHKSLGVPLTISLLNVLPSYIASWGMSVGCTWVWYFAAQDAEHFKVFWNPLLLMFFFTSIVIAAFKGAFETD